MMQTRFPFSARAAERFTAVVVLPTPPFWLITAILRIAWHSIFKVDELRLRDRIGRFVRTIADGNRESPERFWLAFVALCAGSLPAAYVCHKSDPDRNS